MMDETERELRDLTCPDGCGKGLPFWEKDPSRHHNKHLNTASSDCFIYPVCTYNPKLLPLFQQGVAGAYAAAANYVKSRREKLIPDAVQVFDVLADHILALTPADARQAQTGERMACGHLKADWVELIPTTHGYSNPSYCRTCKAIASAEARARLSEHIRNCNFCTETEMDCFRGRQLDAAARTPDSGGKTDAGTT